MRSLVAALLEPVAYPSVYDVTVRAVGDGTISLAGDHDDLRRDGVYGVYSERAYGRIGAIVEQDAAGVVRTLEPAVEELLRFDSPVQMLFGRSADADLEIGGLSLVAGQRIVLLLGAANRDPEVFTEPEKLRLDRRGETQTEFLARVAQEATDCDRIVVMGPGNDRLAFEREYVSLYQRPDRLLDDEPAFGATRFDLLDRLRMLDG